MQTTIIILSIALLILIPVFSIIINKLLRKLKETQKFCTANEEINVETIEELSKEIETKDEEIESLRQLNHNLVDQLIETEATIKQLRGEPFDPTASPEHWINKISDLTKEEMEHMIVDTNHVLNHVRLSKENERIRLNLILKLQTKIDHINLFK